MPTLWFYNLVLLGAFGLVIHWRRLLRWHFVMLLGWAAIAWFAGGTWTDTLSLTVLLVCGLLPVGLHAWANVLVTKHRFNATQWVFRLYQLVAPLRPVAHMAKMARGLQHIGLHQFDQANVIADELMVSSLSANRITACTLWIYLKQCDRVLAFATEAQLAKMPELLNNALHALALTGQRNAMIALAQQHWHRLSPAQQAFPLCVMGCYCGQPVLWQVYGSHALNGVLPSVRQLWQITYDRAVCGDETTYTQQLTRLRPQADGLTQQAIEYRLQAPLFDEPLMPESQAALDAWATEGQQFKHYQPPDPASNGLSLTLGLALICVIAFYAREWLAGSSYPVLYQWGALFYPAMAQQQQWWRLITASFTHANAMHLWFNLSVLWVWGTQVERALGKRWLLGLFLASSVLGMLAELSIFQMVEPLYPKVMLGASAGVMGMLGVRLGMAMQGWLRHQVALAASDVKGILTMLLLQIGIDIMSPGVAAHAHLAGFLGGLVLYVVCFLPRFGFARGKALAMTTGIILLASLGSWGSVWWLTYQAKPLTGDKAFGYAMMSEAASQPVETVQWLQRAAQLHQPDAAYYMGLYYYQGTHVAKNAVKAVTWWKQAAAQRSLEAQYAVAYCYLEGVGVTKSLPDAFYWLTLATKNPADGKEKAWAVNALKTVEPQLTPAQKTAQLARLALQKPD